MIRIERGEHIVILLEENKVGVIEKKGGQLSKGSSVVIITVN